MLQENIKYLQEQIDNCSYQRFKLSETTIIPDEKAQHNLDLLLQKISLKDKTILDIGCNLGLFSIICKQKGAEYVMGIDPLSEAIILAKKIADFLNLDITYKNRSVTDSIIYEGKFDLLICMSCYHYIFKDYKNHKRIFQIFYQLCDEMFFEDAIDTTEDEWVNKMFEDNNLQELKSEYTKDKFFDAALRYFDIEYLGKHVGGKREIYWMKRKKEIRDEDTINELIFYNKTTGVKIKKIGDVFGNYKCLKEIPLIISPIEKIKNNSGCYEYIKKSYKLYYDKIKDIPEITKIYKFWEDNEVYYILKEYNDGYKNIYHFENSEILREQEKEMVFLDGYYKGELIGKVFTEKERLIIFHKIMEILMKIHSRGIFLPDFGLKNFMINRNLDIKAIDLDFIISTEAYTNAEKKEYTEKENLLSLFYNFMNYMFIWVMKFQDEGEKK